MVERMEGEEEDCDTRVCLGNGCGGYGGSEERWGHGQGQPPVKLHMLFPTRLDTIEEEGAVEEEEKEGDCDGNGNDHGKSGTWKKHTLTKEQSSMLQGIFKERTRVDMVGRSLSLSLIYVCISALRDGPRHSHVGVAAPLKSWNTLKKIP